MIEEVTPRKGEMQIVKKLFFETSLDNEKFKEYTTNNCSRSMRIV
jgi:hypothetical protein